VALAQSEWPTLHTLGLGCNNIGDEGVIALAGSTGLPALKTLFLNSNQIGAAGAQALADSPALADLEWLFLGFNSPLNHDSRANRQARRALRQRFGKRLLL